MIRPPRSFAARLTLLVTLTTGISVVLVAGILAAFDYFDTEHEMEMLAESQVEIIRGNAEAPLTFGDPELGREALAPLRNSYNVGSASLFTADGEPFAQYRSDTIDVPEFELGDLGRHTNGRWLVVTGPVTGPEGEDVGRLQVVFDRSSSLARASYNATVVVAIAAMMMLISWYLSTRIARFLVRPIAELASTARQVSETKDYSVRARHFSDDELGRFTGAFNEMLAQIQQQQLEIKQSHDQRAELLESEQAARGEAERASRLKDEFVATLSHELRTPLSAILGWAHILREPGIDSDQVRAGVEVIERNARAQAQIIEDLLDMSRIIAGQIRLDVQQVELGEAVESALATVRPAAEAKGIRLYTLVDPRVGQVRGDPARLQQIVWNLLSNAIKFTPKDGRVEIALARVNSHVEISVADTGQGIRPEFLPHVFDRFRQADGSTTRRHSGLGLGLAIVKQLVELHGGTIRARSDGAGKGSTFTVELPVMPVHAGEIAQRREHPESPRPYSAAQEPLSLTGLRVLVVDDEPDAREIVRRLLAGHGAEPECASSADEALDAFQRTRPDVIVSDIGMPEKDGYELIRDIREMEKKLGGTTPAVALTAFARSADRTRAMLAGYQMHLAKPVEPAELIATVASVSRMAGRRELN